MQPDGSIHCIQFWRTGNCQWTGRCRFPHQCYVCGSTTHGTAQHSLAAAGISTAAPGVAYPPAAASPYAAQAAYGGHAGYPAAAAPMPAGYGGGAAGMHAPAGGPVAGDWQCTSCGWGNYPERQTCRKCNMPRPAAASAALAAAGAVLAPPDGKQHCIQFWRTGACQWVGRCRFPHQCQLCGSESHGTGQHASMAVATTSPSLPAAMAPLSGSGANTAPLGSAGGAYGYSAPVAAAPEPAPTPAPVPTATIEVPLAAPAKAAAEEEAAPAPAGDEPAAEPAAAEPAGAEEGRGRSRSRSPVRKSEGEDAGARRSRSRSAERKAGDSPAPAAQESRYD